MTSKNKKRVILPTRPEPPTIEQILEDVRSAQPSDPVFVTLIETNEDSVASERNESSAPERESQYQQSQSYVAFNQRLQEAQSILKEKCEKLKSAGEQLDESILNMKERAF
ncbi:UPF0449 protein C19orf25 homolog [Latimeria chalumnae]|uniref:Chromosome 19 open reading frame 25 n=1 Tax=Latimeria chalumnae TaxID=7897 RepID=H3AHQ5_LATCH|nr:PREDICTED: UPF0449 protein C19orf25 homolog [Latimeria chalumnae]|eukprot:XP_005999921.1 PREDICTED: UPF0449 protein C19orf25 homolog [Latimeria chalumnae]